MERLEHALNFVRNYKTNSGNNGKSANDSHSVTDKMFSIKVYSNVEVAVELQDRWTWCFANCSQTVCAMVESIWKCKELRDRIAQLMGWQDALSAIVGNKCNTFIDICCWQNTIFSQVWRSLIAKLDTDKRLKLNDQLYWRSYTANIQLHVNKLLAMIAWLLERIAYRNMTSNIVKARLSTLISSVINAVDKVPLAERIEEFRDEIKMDRQLLSKSAKSVGFRPYRFFLGSDNAPGTGMPGTFVIFL